MKSTIKKMLLVATVLGISATTTQAFNNIPPFIEGESIATLITEEGDYNGWYLYTLDITWDLRELGDPQGAGLSHWDLILKDGCDQDDHKFDFASPSGYSSDGEMRRWQNYFSVK